MNGFEESYLVQSAKRYLDTLDIERTSFTDEENDCSIHTTVCELNEKVSKLEQELNDYKKKSTYQVYSEDLGPKPKKRAIAQRTKRIFSSLKDLCEHTSTPFPLSL